MPRARAGCCNGSSPAGEAHARFVNTLARLEYVGVRKILKSRRSERIDLDGLQHILDEAVHALRLKKAAVALAGSGDGVFTFADGATLAGNAGEAYLQALDRRAEEMLIDLPSDDRSDANYRLTSAAIEVRAQVFYPIYEECLRAGGVGFSVACDLEGRGPPPGGNGGGAGAGAARLAPAAGSGARRGGDALRPIPVRGRGGAAGSRVPMAQFRSLSADDVRGDPGRVRRSPGYRAHRPIAVGTINTNVASRPRTAPCFLRINEGKSEDDVAREAAIVAHAAARGVPTPPRPRADGRPASLVAGRAGGEPRSCRCSRGCRAARWRAPR